jgi:hypothetical protein
MCEILHRRSTVSIKGYAQSSGRFQAAAREWHGNQAAHARSPFSPCGKMIRIKTSEFRRMIEKVTALEVELGIDRAVIDEDS